MNFPIIQSFSSFVSGPANRFINSDFGKIGSATVALGLIATAVTSLPPLAMAVGTVVVLSTSLAGMGFWAATQLASQ